MSASTEQKKIPALTSLRFFAALHVVLYHTAGFSFPILFAIPLMREFISVGNIAVGFFFLLSGYILSYVYLQSGKPILTKRFYHSRIARIYPLYLMTLVLDTPNLFLARLHTYGLHAAIQKTSITFLSNLVMIQAWIPRLRGIDDPNWSLCAEAVFYLTFPILGLTLWKISRRTLTVGLALLWIATEVFLYHHSIHYHDQSIFYNPLFHIPTFLVGILVARIQLSSKAAKTVSAISNTWLLSFAAILMIAAIPFLLKILPMEDILTSMLTPLFAVLILIFSSQRNPFSAILNANIMVLLGEASYGLYLINIPVYHLWMALHWDTIQALYPVYLALCITLSVVSFRYFETPTRLWLLSKFRSTS